MQRTSQETKYQANKHITLRLKSNRVQQPDDHVLGKAFIIG
jgi:hypothetical protein